MPSKKPGKNISKVEIGNIDRFGIWLLYDDHEYFLDYEHYPWFKDAHVNDILNVELSHKNHLHWPDLDIDLELESLTNPEKYPLVYQ